MDGADIDDVVVVGGGPAGLTAATYLGRLHRRVRVLDAGASRARWIPESNNCPGFPHGISGIDLLARLREQAAGYGAAFEAATVTGLVRAGHGYTVVADGGRQWRARAVILATGLADRLPDMEHREEAIACGALRLCPVCDAYEASDQDVGVFGRWRDIAAHARFLRGYTARLSLLPMDAAGARDDLGDVDARVLPAGGRLLFVEHGLAPQPGVRWWQDRLTPIWKRIGGGCHLNRPIAALVEGAGFELDRLATGYMRGPKPMAFMYEGSARPR